MKNLRKNSVHICKSYWPLLLIIALPAIFFWKTFVRGDIPIPSDFIVGVYYPWLDYKWGYEVGVPVKNPIMADVVSFTYPMQTYAVYLLKSGHAPLWNPFILTGTPLLANFQSAPFAITNIVYFFTTDAVGWSLKIILQHLLALLSVYLLLKYWKVSKIGSIFGGVVFAFGGFNIIWSQWSAHVLTASCIPVLILLVDKWFEKRNLGIGALLSLILGIQILSGYPQVVLYSGFALALLWLTKFRFNLSFAIDTISLGLFGLLGLGVASIQLLPARELLSLSQRSVEPHPYEWAFLPLKKVITFFASDYFGNHVTNNYWGPQDYTSTTGFVGVVGSSLGILGLTGKRRRAFLVILLISSLLLSFPTPLSIWIWKSGFLGLQAASAHRALVLMNLAIALLAGFGLDQIISLRHRAWMSVLIPLFVIICFALGTLLLWIMHRSDASYLLAGNIHWVSVGLRNLVIPFALSISLISLLLLLRFTQKFYRLVTIACLLLLITELFRFGWKFTPMSPSQFLYPSTPVIDYLQAQEKPFRVTGSKVIPINLRMPYGLESLEGYDAVYPLQIAKFVAVVNKGGENANPLGRYAIVDNDISPLLPLTNTKYVLALKKDAKENPTSNGTVSSSYAQSRYQEVFADKTTVVLKDNTAEERAFMRYQWSVIPDETDLLKELLKNENKTIFIEKDPIIQPHGEGKSTVHYVSYEQQESILSVETTKDGILFISDAYYPGWKAAVDGKEAEILKADYAFRAIAIQAGTHVIRMWYDPDSYRNGVIGSLISLTIIGVLLILSARSVKNLYTLHK